MPTDLQASTSSTSSMCKQNSLEDNTSSYSLDKSRDESSLSRELYLANLPNGTVSSNSNCDKRSSCCTPKDVNCVFENGISINDRLNNDVCKIFCSNPNCNQSGWIHLVCIKAWEKRIKSDIMCLRPQLRAYIDRQINCSINAGGQASSSSDNGSALMELLQNVLPTSCLCRCNLGNLIRLEPQNSNAPRPQLLESNTHYSTTNLISNCANTRRKIGPNNSNSNSINNNNNSFNNFIGQSGNVNFGPNNNSNNNCRKNSAEFSSNTFNNFNRRMRSRTLSATQMLASLTEQTGNMYINSPYEYSTPSNNSIGQFNKKDFSTSSNNNSGPAVTKQQYSKNSNGLISNVNSNKNNKSHNRQRHHSSCYHGSNNALIKDDYYYSNNNNNSSKPKTNSAGNIFKQRSNFKTFQLLPFAKQNAYFIQMEDDSCTGNDDTKVYLLTHLSQANRSCVDCLICGVRMPVYDHLPLIDGTFFLSPICHSLDRCLPIPANSNPPGTISTNANNSNNNQMTNSHVTDKYLHAMCVNCMHEIVICCQNCHRPWTGAQLLVGSLYTYDVFAAVPCCPSRLMCNKCNKVCVLGSSTQDSIKSTNINSNKVSTSTTTNPNNTTITNTNGITNSNTNTNITNSSNNTNNSKSNNNNNTTPTLVSLLSNFSQLSRCIECIHCHTKDYHFVKPFSDIFKPIGISG